ncbi:hypothetical protein L6164_034378 [Bauhinia variegata]|uniref:Uncharacterized protein n=1 Tax=Bauhinia variegata TaxID=167791 RepID=A0ACB9KUN2_BAUVA|nr:hypothetical protein L6164_034378 [Bauhinia variegata]
MVKALVWLHVLLVGLAVAGATQSSSVNGGEFTADYSKLTGIIIPGFLSTQLRAWSFLDCPYSPLDFNPLDSVWLDLTKLAISGSDCWLKCMVLDPYNQTDDPECKSRPDSGLSAITEIDPGYFTGPLSSVWKDWVKWCIEFGVEANAIIAVPYDWRLSPSALEERDLYFHKLKLTFETTLKLRGGPSLVFAHSLGNNIFRYFLEWLKFEIAPKHYIQWLDQHIHAYFAIGAPLLGATENIAGTLSGFTFGLPIPEAKARLMFSSFASSLWMIPFSKYCRADNKYWKRFSGGSHASNRTYHCDEKEFQSKFSGWPINIINIEIPSTRDWETRLHIPLEGFDAHRLAEFNEGFVRIEKGFYDDAYTSFSSKVAQGNMSRMERGFPTVLSFSAREISDGTFFKAIEDYDPDSKRLLYQLEKLYLGDPVLNPLTPWDRPPIKNVFCIYGIGLKTKIGHYFAPSGKPYPDNWITTDEIYEFDGSLISKSGNLVEGNPGVSSGDRRVPYNSLAWCKNWLGPKVNITRAPQSEHDGSDVQVELNVQHHHDEDIIPDMSKSPRVKYITYYEDSESLPGMRTAVWEIDGATHMGIIKSPVLMRELWLEIWHDIHPGAKSGFVRKDKRGPLRDADCPWDYGKAGCALPEYCEYRFVFGDIRFGQSCRLKNTSANLLLDYL